MNMATETVQHVYVLRTWKTYPRVNYLHRRLADLKPRFDRTIRAFPERFHDKTVLDEVDRLYRCLGKLPKIIVTGDDVLKEFEITQEDDNSKTEETLEVRVFCKSDWQLENWKQFLVTQTDDNKIVDIIVVGTVTSQANEDYVRNIDSLNTWMRKENVEIPVLVVPKEKELSNEIEKVLEVHIIRGFEHMYLYMHQYFIGKGIKYYAKSPDVLDKDIIEAVVKDIVQDGDLVGASREKAIESIDMKLKRVIGRRLLCAFVSPLAAKYNIPDFLCYQLLTELNFEKILSLAVSVNTLHELSKLSQDVGKSKGVLSEKWACKVEDSANILINDLRKAVVFEGVDKTFQTTQRVTTVMKKMAFEIRGYLRQSLACSSILEIENPRPKISDALRRDILRNKMVYGMGTMYGELEIHLKSEFENSKSELNEKNEISESDVRNEISESDVRNEISEQMQKHRYPYPYTVRVVDLEPVPFYRQGDITLSPFPDNMGGDHRMGTAGCFVKDQHGNPNLLTCSHVVDPCRKRRHVVQVRKIVNGELTTLRFGVSTPQKTIRPGCASNFPVVDIAAVTAAQERNIRQAVDYNMRNDDGETKPVSFLCGLSDNEVETTVYKYGAVIGLTHGIVCSTDYCRAENDQDNGPAERYIMLIDDVPDNPNNDHVFQGAGNFVREEQAQRPPSRNFASEGDSGAIICFDDYAVDPAGTIVVASMLNGGRCKFKGDTIP